MEEEFVGFISEHIQQCKKPEAPLAPLLQCYVNSREVGGDPAAKVWTIFLVEMGKLCSPQQPAAALPHINYNFTARASLSSRYGLSSSQTTSSISSITNFNSIKDSPPLILY